MTGKQLTKDRRKRKGAHDKVKLVVNDFEVILDLWEPAGS